MQDLLVMEKSTSTKEHQGGEQGFGIIITEKLLVQNVDADHGNRHISSLVCWWKHDPVFKSRLWSQTGQFYNLAAL